ncbi:MAG: nucleotide exchange factor GrpE [Chlorobi bacterium]|nr:nucleotide exchange factor GrpE [Chlorobiota bacterium]
MDEHKPFHKRMQDLVNTYIKQEQSAHGDETAAIESSGNPETALADSSHVSTPELEALKQHITELESQLHAVERERDELRDKYIRAIADIDNLRKRTEREKEQLVLFATERLFSRLVEVLDDLHAAVEAGRRSRDYDAMLNGLEMIAAKAHKLYEEHGVRPLEARTGEPFNVELHEALVHMPHQELPEGAIVEQVQRGYLFKDRVLRHARVVTSAGTAAAGASANDSPQSNQ